MADFDLNSIGALLSGGGVKAIASRVKVKQADVAKVLSAGIPALLSGMHDNASEAAGEASLRGALADHGKDDTRDVAAFLKGADLKDGKKILGHVLGDNKNALIRKISDETGVTKAKTTSILAIAAPLLLALLAKKNGGILNLLGGLLGLGGSSGAGAINLGGGSNQSSASGGLLGGLLGGGSLMSGLGSSLLGSLMGSSEPEEEETSSSGGLLSGFLNLFRGGK